MIRLVLILAIVVAVVLIVICLQGDAYKRFMAGAGEVMGRIEKKETRIETPNKQTSENILIYSYTVGGQAYRGEERVEYDDLWLDAREGMELRVYYSKANPAKSYPAVLIDRRLKIEARVR